jgi:hypothetical protein
LRREHDKPGFCARLSSRAHIGQGIPEAVAESAKAGLPQLHGRFDFAPPWARNAKIPLAKFAKANRADGILGLGERKKAGFDRI